MRQFVPPNVLAALWRFYRRTEQAELDLIAAGVAFYGFLAIFPAAAAVIAIWVTAFEPWLTLPKTSNGDNGIESSFSMRVTFRN